MSIKRSIGYLLVGLVAFVFASGFLGLCQKNYAPCTIEFTSPGNGQVFPVGTEVVDVKGIVKAGSAKPSALYVGKNRISLNASNNFSYKWALPQGKLMSTCTFLIVDAKGISTKERLTVVVGESVEPTAASPVTDDGARLFLSQDALRVATEEGADMINKYKNDVVYGVNKVVRRFNGSTWEEYHYGSGDAASPFASMTPLLPINQTIQNLGEIKIDPDYKNWENRDMDQGFINIGTLKLDVKTENNNIISAGLSINPDYAVNPYDSGQQTALFIQGWSKIAGVSAHFRVSTKNAIAVSNVKVSVQEKNGNVFGVLDLTNADIDLGVLDLEYGDLKGRANFDSGLLSWITNLVKKNYLNKLTYTFPLTDLPTTFEAKVLNMDLGVWLMDPAIYYGTTEGISVDLGVGAKLSDGYFPLFPQATGFYYTGPSVLPALHVEGGENVKVAINDNVVNNLAFVAIQGGLLAQGMDVTESFRGEIIKQGLKPGKNFKATVKLITPPVIDFTQSQAQVFGETVTRPAALYIHNLTFEMTNILDVNYPTYLKMSWDGDLGVKLTLSDDGTRIKGGVDFPTSDSTVTICYENVGNVAFYPVLAKEIANGLFDSVLGVIDFKIPIIDMYGMKIKASLVDISSENHCIVASVKLDNNLQ